MVEKIESVVIGGGQAGLSLSYYLSRAGREHIVLEKASQVANAWRNRRWDSFTLITPNWSFRLPGAEYTDSEPEGFMPKKEIIRRFEQFELQNQLPVRYSTRVERLNPSKAKSISHLTEDKVYESKNVIFATGCSRRQESSLCHANTARTPSNPL